MADIMNMMKRNAPNEGKIIKLFGQNRGILEELLQQDEARYKTLFTESSGVIDQFAALQEKLLGIKEVFDQFAQLNYLKSGLPCVREVKRAGEKYGVLRDTLQNELLIYLKGKESIFTSLVKQYAEGKSSEGKLPEAIHAALAYQAITGAVRREFMPIRENAMITDYSSLGFLVNTQFAGGVLQRYNDARSRQELGEFSRYFKESILDRMMEINEKYGQKIRPFGILRNICDELPKVLGQDEKYLHEKGHIMENIEKMGDVVRAFANPDEKKAIDTEGVKNLLTENYENSGLGSMLYFAKDREAIRNLRTQLREAFTEYLVFPHQEAPTDFMLEPFVKRYVTQHGLPGNTQLRTAFELLGGIGTYALLPRSERIGRILDNEWGGEEGKDVRAMHGEDGRHKEMLLKVLGWCIQGGYLGFEGEMKEGVKGYIKAGLNSTLE